MYQEKSCMLEEKATDIDSTCKYCKWFRNSMVFANYSIGRQPHLLDLFGNRVFGDVIPSSCSQRAPFRKIPKAQGFQPASSIRWVLGGENAFLPPKKNLPQRIIIGTWVLVQMVFLSWYCWWFRNPKQPPGMYKTLKKIGIKYYQPQLVSRISGCHQQDFWGCFSGVTWKVTEQTFPPLRHDQTSGQPSHIDEQKTRDLCFCRWFFFTDSIMVILVMFCWWVFAGDFDSIMVFITSFHHPCGEIFKNHIFSKHRRSKSKKDPPTRNVFAKFAAKNGGRIVRSGKVLECPVAPQHTWRLCVSQAQCKSVESFRKVASSKHHKHPTGKAMNILDVRLEVGK